MRTLSCAILVAAALLGCGKPSSDIAGSPKLQTAVIAGGLALSTIHRCLLHIERAHNTAAPQCNASDQVRAYEDAKSRVPANATPALRHMDEAIERARAEAVGQLIRLAVDGSHTQAHP